MFRTVVVPVAWGDVPQTTITHAAAIARQAGADLDLLTIKPTYLDLDRTQAHLARVAEVHCPSATLRVAEAGDPAEAIATVGSDPGTLLCMATHARRPLSELAFGSVSAQVMRTCRRPVLLVGPNCRPAPPAYKSMVVALDGSELAEAILPVAAEWCTHLELTPWLYQVLPGLVPFEHGDGDAQDMTYVRHIADWFTGHDLEAGWDAAHDRHPADAIARFADEHEPAILALTTHGRTGLNEVAMGSVALAVAHRATCPVLVRHPRHS